KLEPAVAGPKRQQDKILVKNLHDKFEELLAEEFNRKYVPVKSRQEGAWLSEGGSGTEFTYHEKRNGTEVVVEHDQLKTVRVKLEDEEYLLSDGDIAIAAITSCTNTSNPSVMVGAGLVAKK